MALFSQLKYNNYVPQYVGMPLNEFMGASTAVQNRYDQIRENYSLVGELADTLQVSPLDTDRDVKRQLITDVQAKIDEAAKRGDFDTMQNEMRKLAKDYAKKAQPLTENLNRYSAAEKAIMESKLPQSHISYLRNQLRQSPGLSFDEFGVPNYSQFNSFAENVDLREVYEKYINDYKSDKAPQGVRKEFDDETGLVEYFAIGSNEKVDSGEVLAGLQLVALQDPKVQDFILQDAAANGQQIKTNEDFLNYSAPLMAAYAEKAGFNKQDLQIRVGEAGRARAKSAEDKSGGLTFDFMWGEQAKAGTASPQDLRQSRETLEQQRESVNDEYTKFLSNNGDPIDPLTGISRSGQNYRELTDRYSQQLDGIDAQKWELDKVEADAKTDAGLPLNWTPSKEVLAKAEQASADAIQAVASSSEVTRGGKVVSEAEYKKIGQEAYNKALDKSNDPNVKAYRTALARNAQQRTTVKGMTTFNKNVTAELESIGDALIAGTWGNVAAYDVATGQALDNLKDYGTAVKRPMWTVDNGKVVLAFQTGNMDKNQFISSNKWIKVEAPPELEEQLVSKKILDPLDLDIMKQAATGRVKIGQDIVRFETKRAGQTGPAEVVLVYDDGFREAYDSQGDAIKRLARLMRKANGNR
jgi:hypothetical protein